MSCYITIRNRLLILRSTCGRDAPALDLERRWQDEKRLLHTVTRPAPQDGSASSSLAGGTRACARTLSVPPAATFEATFLRIMRMRCSIFVDARKSHQLPTTPL